ncbi:MULTISPECIES: SDR family oxidoreductase [Streptomyces violaceusniger group]|uniref:SDR family oxidoreductase n=2 Tax=Streptomyces rhizosphaericus TaxID=114699 RepID=A0ABN1RRF3_9ACTN|nr:MULTISPECIES: SDR family oxidoreductase [Streptomyces violaceusniger group]
MKLAGQTALVTGANRGIGRRFVVELLARDVRKVYAGIRNPDAVDVEMREDPRVELVRLDITDIDMVEAAARQAEDVSVLINNAGIIAYQPLLEADVDTIRREIETSVFGTLSMARAFAPALRARQGAMTNILSALAWFSYPGSGGYSAGKAAAWSLTNSLRLELAPAGVLVQGVHLGSVDTDFSAGYDGFKIDPTDVARSTLDGIENDQIEVLVDDWSRAVKAALTSEPNAVLNELIG